MNTDEFKALRLRRSQLYAEIARIDVLLDTEYEGEGAARTPKLSTREAFYRDAENDFRNVDSNGNYVTPPEDC